MLFVPITTFVWLYTSWEQRPAGNSGKNFSGTMARRPRREQFVAAPNFYRRSAKFASGHAGQTRPDAQVFS
jgi:hypothetical protein